VHVARRLLARKLGFRNLLDVIPIKDTTLVKGSHGRITTDDDAPLVISNETALLPEDAVLATNFKDLVLAHVFER
jgi:hypothetical protein